MNDPHKCLVTWPTDPTDGDLIAPNLRPQHACRLHVLHLMPGTAMFDLSHVCYCGAILPVRDVEPAAQS